MFIEITKKILTAKFIMVSFLENGLFCRVQKFFKLLSVKDSVDVSAKKNVRVFNKAKFTVKYL